jgi:hypothetical protein
MSRYVPIQTPGGLVLAEVDDSNTSQGVVLTAKGEVFKDFEGAVNALKRNAAFLLESLEDLAPQEVEVSFGIKAGAEAGIAIFGLAKASGEASYEVKLTWKADEADRKTTK